MHRDVGQHEIRHRDLNAKGNMRTKGARIKAAAPDTAQHQSSCGLPRRTSEAGVAISGQRAEPVTIGTAEKSGIAWQGCATLQGIAPHGSG